MAEVKRTPEQDRAVKATGHNILVAASAGSGKTMVLIDRIMRILLEERQDITNLLVVTFTNAAAREMKEKLRKKIQQVMPTVEQAAKKHLLRQLELLDVADICTLDAYCLQFFKQYYYLVDVDPVFRLLTDSTEEQRLFDQAYDKVRQQFFEDEAKARQVVALVDNFGDSQFDEGVKMQVLRLYDYMQTRADGLAWLAKLPDYYRLPECDDIDAILADEQKCDALISRSDFFAHHYAQAMSEQLQNIATQYRAAVDKISEQSGTVSFGRKNAREATQEKNQAEFFAQVEAESKLLAKNYTLFVDQPTYVQLKASLTPDLARLKGNPSGEAAEAFKQVRDATKKKLAELAGVLKPTASQQVKLMMAVFARLTTLTELTRTFATEILRLKRRKNVYSFGDIEQFTLKILQQATPRAQAIKRQLQTKYCEIMVDEYQDTNALQEMILQQLTKKKPGNMFMVGDVKQSIYGFRQADPQLFLEKYHQYQQAKDLADYADGARYQTSGELIVLTKNFRSTKNITGVVNLIFRQLMDEQIGGINYDDNAALQFGATYYPATAPKRAEVLVYDTTPANEPAVDAAPETLSKNEAISWATLTRIKQLVEAGSKIAAKDGTLRQMTYGDIAILTRNNAISVTLANVGKQLGVPLTFSRNENYYRTVELRVMLSLLKIIDNPNQDIPLAAVLRSPIVGLNADELAAIRINDKTADYFAALQSFVHPDNPAGYAPAFIEALVDKVKAFLALLDKWRTLSRKVSVAELIWTIYQDTHYPEFVAAMANGTQRQANLHALYERAAEFESNNYRGVYDFVNYITLMSENNKDIGAAAIDSANQSVKVMTMHASKGLEFDVVFVLELDRTITPKTDNASKLRLMPDAAAAMDVRLPLKQVNEQAARQEGIYADWLVSYHTMQKAYADTKTQTRLAAEEMRLLYVALTRAKQQLVLVTANEAAKVFATVTQVVPTQLTLPKTLRLKASQTMFGWINAALMRTTNFTDKVIAANLSATTPPLIPEKKQPNWFSQDDMLTTLGLTVMTAADFSVRQEEQRNNNNWLEKTMQQLDEATPALDSNLQIALTTQYHATPLVKTPAYQAVSDIRRMFDDPDVLAMQEIKANEVQTTTAAANVTPEFALPDFMQTKTDQPSAATVGTATHLILQQCDVKSRPTLAALKATCARLVANHVIEADVAAAINFEQIAQFFLSELGQRVLAHSDTLRREAAFSMLVPANMMNEATNSSQPILIHGIIDGYFIDDDGEIVLFDYKTDYTSDVAQLLARYQGQLRLYQKALNAANPHHLVKEMWLHSLTHNHSIAVN